MVSRILIAAYIVSVLLIAGFARAEGNSLTIEHLDFKSQMYLVHIKGHLMDPCSELPTPSIVASNKSPYQYKVELTTQQSAEVCAQVGPREFEVVFDLRTVMNPGVQVLTDRPLTFEVGQNTLEVQWSSSFRQSSFGFASVQKSGVIAKDTDGSLILRSVENGEVKKTSLSSVGIDMNKYLNQTVAISGHLIPHQTFTFRSYGTDSAVGLPPQHIARLLVTGINPTSH